MLVGVNEHEHRDHRQDEDHGKEEDYEEVDSKAGPSGDVLELHQPVGGLADLEADLRAHTHGAKRLHRAQAVLTVQEARDLGDALRQRAEHHGAV